EKNIVLENATFGPGIPSYPFTLLNKIALKIHDDAVSGKIPTVLASARGGVEFDCEIYRKNGIAVNTSGMDFFEHCLLYRFNALPTEPKAKSTLRCFYNAPTLDANNPVLMLGNNPILMLGIGCSDQVALKGMNSKLKGFEPRVSIFASGYFAELERI